jgi:hypothetical protein
MSVQERLHEHHADRAQLVVVAGGLRQGDDLLKSQDGISIHGVNVDAKIEHAIERDLQARMYLRAKWTTTVHELQIV